MFTVRGEVAKAAYKDADLWAYNAEEPLKPVGELGLPRDYPARLLRYHRRCLYQFDEPGLDLGYSKTRYTPRPPISIFKTKDEDAVPDVILGEVYVAGVENFGRTMKGEIFQIDCNSGLWTNSGVSRLILTMLGYLDSYVMRKPGMLLTTQQSILNVPIFKNIAFAHSLAIVENEDLLLPSESVNWTCGENHAVKNCPLYEIGQLVSYARRYNRENADYQKSRIGTVTPSAETARKN